MFSWIATRLFYAIVFFLLGAWAASVSPQLRAMMHHASHVSAEGFDKMRDWTSDTLVQTPELTNPNPAQSSGSATAPSPSGEASQTQTAATPEAAPAPQAPAAPASGAQPANSSQQASAPETPQPAAAPAPNANGAADLLNRARQAYARKDIDSAINAYRAFIEQNPDAIGARGELGNVYYAADRKHDAAQMFFECATKYLDTGQITSAKALVSAVREGDPAMADDLERRIAVASDKKS